MPSPTCPSLPFRLLAVLLLACGPHRVPAADAPTELRIDTATLRQHPGGLTFQVQAPGADPTELALLRSASPHPDSSWVEDPQARLTPVAEGVFQANVPWDGAQAGFLRVRRRVFPPPAPGPRLSEVMTDNATVAASPDGRFWDWVELQNPHDEAVILDGYTLTEERTGGTPWALPAGLLQPGAFAVVQASGLGSGGGTPWHATFQLPSSGATLVLRDGWGRERDRLEVPPLGRDTSVGRNPRQPATLLTYGPGRATPGAANLEGAAEGTVVPPPLVSSSGGFYPAAFHLRLQPSDPATTIRVSTNGAAPGTNSPSLTELLVDRSLVVRAVAVDAAGRRSEEVAHSYFLGPRPRLPVISLAASPTNFTFRDGYLYGMGPAVLSAQGRVLQSYPYSGSNAWKDREAEVHLELHEPDGRVGLRQRAGLQIFGGWGSRGYPQKSFALFARRAYGDGSFDHEIFPGLGIDRFESFVLRNSGNDNQSTHQTPPRPPITAFGPVRDYGSYFVQGHYTLFRDALLQSLTAGMGLDTQAYRPAIVYLNGDYWGIYNLREKFNEEYVLDHHELPEGSIDLIEGYGDVKAGDGTAYSALRNWVATRSMAVETNYQTVARRYLEIDNFIDYHLAVLFFQNFDIGNVKCWRPRAEGGRFRWMLYDQDYGFGLWPAEVYEDAMARDYADYRNMFAFATAGSGTSTAWPNGGGRTLLLRRLLDNPGFRLRFIRRCTDLLNAQFESERVKAAIRTMAEGIRDEIPRHLDRWSWPSLQARGFGAPHQPESTPFALQTWESNVEEMIQFAHLRTATVRQQCLTHFGLEGGVGKLVVESEPAGAGDVQVNSLQVTAPWSGLYFSALTNRLLPVARPGYRFVRWNVASAEVLDPVLDVRTPAGAIVRCTAVFAPLGSPATAPAPLQVTEINYHSPDDREAGDWIELHNPGNQPLDLTGWALRDENEVPVLVLREGTLRAQGRAVLARNPARFILAHPGVEVLATLPFGLDNGGDSVRLFDPTGVPVITVAFTDEAPWPAAADGGGSTLQLKQASADPGRPESWQASTVRGGTPGAP